MESDRLNLDFYTGKDLYSDGDIEDEIMDIVRSGRDFDVAIADGYKWPVIYHLSKQRELIVVPMGITKNDRVLEIGAGCGAITGALAERAAWVDCVELSKKRSQINMARHKEYSNIRIFVGNFEDIVLTQKYDVITLIGVLEYAGMYIHSDEPYRDFLRRIKDLLSPDGRLYIAIENRLGLKYFAGYDEDHVGRAFSGIEGYGERMRIHTFSYTELEVLLREAGFTDLVFYYPSPDYKMPTAIYSDDYFPWSNRVGQDSQNAAKKMRPNFDTALVRRSLKNIEDYRLLANSFLVDARIGCV